MDVVETAAIFWLRTLVSIVAFFIIVIIGDLTEVLHLSATTLAIFFSSTGVIFVPKAGVLPFRWFFLSLQFFFYSFLAFLVFSDFLGFSVP